MHADQFQARLLLSLEAGSLAQRTGGDLGQLHAGVVHLRGGAVEIVTAEVEIIVAGVVEVTVELMVLIQWGYWLGGR